MAERQQWEYLSIFVKADADPVMDYLEERWDWKEGIPRNTPESMIPRLDFLGKEGWELVHMQPVMVRRNADVLADVAGWTNNYFCVFKRPT